MTLDKDIQSALQAPLTREQLATIDARVQTAMATAPRTRKRGLPVRRSLVLAAILAIGVPGLLLGAAVVTTNWFEPISVAELRAEIAIAKSLVPLPPGRVWPAHLNVAESSDTYEAGAGREWVEGTAVCIWFDEWLAARAIGDTNRESAAAGTIASIPTWPSWTSPYWAHGEGDYVGHLRPLIDAVADGDEGPVRGEMQSNCAWVTP